MIEKAFLAAVVLLVLMLLRILIEIVRVQTQPKLRGMTGFYIKACLATVASILAAFALHASGMGLVAVLFAVFTMVTLAVLKVKAARRLE